MRIHSITYDLRKPGHDYGRLIERVKLLGTWCRPTLSQWLVATPLSATQVRDQLLPFIDANDRLLVVESIENAAWHGLAPEVATWLRAQLGRGVSRRV